MASTPAWPAGPSSLTLATPEAARSVIDGLQAEMVQCEWRSSQAEAYAACLTAEASKQRSVIRSLKDKVDGSRAREASLIASLQAEVTKQRELARLEAEARVHAERSAHFVVRLFGAVLNERKLYMMSGNSARTNCSHLVCL